eukprot:6528767-Pyramimonas_sp.AAC.1
MYDDMSLHWDGARDIPMNCIFEWHANPLTSRALARAPSLPEARASHRHACAVNPEGAAPVEL